MPQHRVQLLELRYRALLEILQDTAAERNVEALFEKVTLRLRAAAHFDLLVVALHEVGRNMFRYRLYEAGARAAPGERLPLETYVEEAPAGVVWNTQRPWMHPDIAQEPRGTRLLDLVRSIGIKSVVALPLTTRNRRLGVLALLSYSPNAYLESDLEFLELAAAQVAAVADGVLAFQELAEASEKLDWARLYLEEEVGAEYDCARIVGISPAWRRLMRDVETAAPTDSTVLIRGDSGSGAELVARAIHSRSRRREGAFVKVNCAEPEEELLERLLFGGGGSVARVALADGGTLFLDHIGCLPAAMQARLLNIMREREFECPLRGRRIRADVRVVAATTRDLAPMVAAREFRSDLFYRINVFPVTLPSLAQRREDIPLLAEHFMRRYARRLNRPVERIPAEVREDLVRRPWPGNVRELANLVERAVMLSTGPELRIAPPAGAEPVGGTLEEAEREHILRALRSSGWTVGGPGGAAAKLGMKRTTLQSRMRKLGIDRRAAEAAAR